MCTHPLQGPLTLLSTLPIYGLPLSHLQRALVPPSPLHLPYPSKHKLTTQRCLIDSRL
jgi:hypothetical protein